MQCIIVCHAGMGIGVGHLTRSLVIANALNNKFKCDILFLIQGNYIEREDLKRYNVKFISFIDDLASNVREIFNTSVKQLFVFDIYHGGISNNFLDLLVEMQKSNCISIGVDALIKFNSLLDMVFMPTFKNQPIPMIGSNTKIISGWDCFLLNTKRKAPLEIKRGRNILVLTGGSDATGLGKTFPNLLNKFLADSNVEINWVIGPFAVPPILIDNHKGKWVFHQAPNSLDDLMINTNFAISVYGVSFYELLHYGIPTVVFSPYGNKDDEELAIIRNEEVALVASNEMDAIEKVKNLMSDGLLSSALSQNGKKKLADSSGQRFVTEINEIIKRKWLKAN